MRWNWIGLAACMSFANLGVAASEQEPDVVTFAAGHRVPATLTLYETKGDPAGRLTPIYNNYRPKISFGSGDIICMFYLTAPVRSVAPGETAAVSISCEDSITVGSGGGRFVVTEGGKEVGFGQVRGAPPTGSR